MPSIQKQFPQLVTIRGAAQARTDLQITDFDPTPLIADISGAESAIVVISGALTTLTANTSADIYNLDVSLSNQIATLFDITGSASVATSANNVWVIPVSAAGYIQVTFSDNTTGKIPFFR